MSIHVLPTLTCFYMSTHKTQCQLYYKVTDPYRAIYLKFAKRLYKLFLAFPCGNARNHFCSILVFADNTMQGAQSSEPNHQCFTRETCACTSTVLILMHYALSGVVRKTTHANWSPSCGSSLQWHRPAQRNAQPPHRTTRWRRCQRARAETPIPPT